MVSVYVKKKKAKTLVLNLKQYIKTRRKLVMGLVFSYPRNTPNLGSIVMGLGMRPKPKIQTQFFTGINECLILFKNQDLSFRVFTMTCVYSSHPVRKVYHPIIDETSSIEPNK